METGKCHATRDPLLLHNLSAVAHKNNACPLKGTRYLKNPI
jgi:hypothetical protein